MDTEQQPPPSGGSPQPENEFTKIGTTMFLMALFLGGLTLFFSHQQKSYVNPNQNPDSHIDAMGTKVVTLKRNPMGHYLTSGEINGHPVTFLLDTGATDVAIPAELESKLNVRRGRSIRLHTANGISNGYTTRIDVLTIGEITLYSVDATIAPNMQGEEVLLGMSVLKQLDFSQSGNYLELRH